MASDVEICNLALSHVGVGKEIAAIDERSAEAQACRRYLETARKQVLRGAPWPFATKFADLALVEADPTTEWGFSYRYPTDCLKFRRILSGARVDSQNSRITYRIGQDAQGLLIYTDQETATAEYTVLEDDPERYPVDFVVALSFLLASYVAPRVTGGDPFKLGPLAAQKYDLAISKAQADAYHEEQPEQPPEAESIQARA